MIRLKVWFVVAILHSMTSRAHCFTAYSLSRIPGQKKVSLASALVASTQIRQRQPTTALKAVPSSAISAASGLLVSTFAGTVSEKKIPNSGILSTLISSAVLSNLGLIPPTHALYDWCWSVILPASLALLLLQEEGSDSASTKGSNAGMLPVGLAFCVASIASMIGCTVSFLVCRAFPSLWLPPASASIAGGCLCASYIGGSINFFSAARLLDAKSSLLSAMAAADLLVMAVYFAWLVAALQNKRLLKWFGDDDVRLETNSQVSNIQTSTIKEVGSSSAVRTSIRTKIAASICVSFLAWSMAVVANHAEAILNPFVTGTACAVICLLATIVPKVASFSGTRQHLWNAMRQMAGPLGAFSFQLFFAAVGISANLGQALQAGPASLWFSATALGIHMLLTIGGCLGLNRLLGMVPSLRTSATESNSNASYRLQLKHVLVASNAAIGGPATAAAYAGQQQTGLTVAATVWGVLGYGVGTSLGISLSRMFQGLL